MRLLRRGWKSWTLFSASMVILMCFLHAAPAFFSAPSREENAVRNGPLLQNVIEWREPDVHRVTRPTAPGNESRSSRSGFSGEQKVNKGFSGVNTSVHLHDQEDKKNVSYKQVLRNDRTVERDVRKVKNVSFAICRDARVLPRRSRPSLALASVPGSGNTWVRYLLERASGISTGSVYMDKKLYAGGFIGEFVNPHFRNTLIVKTHDTGSSWTTRHYTGAIVIIRNPYHTLLSYANLVNAGHTGWATEEYFKSAKWDGFVKSSAISWEDRITTWITRKNVEVLFYEHLKTDLRNEISRLLKFLDVPIYEDRLDCMEAHAEGSFHRQKKKTGDFNPFREKHRAIVEAHIKVASDALRKAGYTDYDLSYSELPS